VGALALMVGGCRWASSDDHEALVQRVDSLWAGVLMHQATLEEWRDWSTSTEFPALLWAVGCLQRTSPTWPCPNGSGITPPPDSLPKLWP
jgi:hypothetical protein